MWGYNGTAHRPVADSNSTSTSEYEELLTDIWIGVLLSTALLSCICCMCSCLLFHKFQKWKRLVLHDVDGQDIAANDDSLINSNYDSESLPSYTIASGLPSYDDAIKQLEIVKKNKSCRRGSGPPPLRQSPSQVSLMNKFTIVNEKKENR